MTVGRRMNMLFIFCFLVNHICRDLVGHFGCVNAVEFSPDGMTLASGGDDKRLLVSRTKSLK